MGPGRPSTRPNRTQTCPPEPLQMEPGRQLEAGLAGGWDGTACLPGSPLPTPAGVRSVEGTVLPAGG